MRRRALLKASVAAGALSGFCFRPSVAAQAAAGGEAASVLGAPRLALVIGNDRYRDSPLKNPVNDARAVTAELQASDFAVTTLLDAGLAEMRERVQAFGGELARTRGVGVFYFAGHGIQLSWRNYLLPVDTQIAGTDEVPGKAVDLALLLETLGKASNPANIVILDACRNNPFGRDFRVDQRGLSQVDAPVGTLLAYATAPGNVAIDGEGANGLYTEHLLKEMRVPDAKVEDIFKRVRLAVRRQSKGLQIPWESTSLEDDFYFQPPEELKRAAEAERQRRAQAEQAAREEAEGRRRQAEAARLARERAAEAERRRLEEGLKRQHLAEAEHRQRLQAAEEARARAEAQSQRDAEAERRARAAAEAARQRQEAEAALARQQAEAAQRRRLDEARAARERDEAERRRRFEAEQAEWERIVGSSDPSAFAAYLYRYPRGSFTEMAQLRLDQLLAEQGEKRIEAASAAGNPFTQGTLRADIDYKIGDAYTYRFTDLYTGNELRAPVTQRVTGITASEIRFNDGALVLDRLGSVLRLPDGRRFAGRQDHPVEYAVGRKWISRFHAQLPSGSVATGEMALRVVARETITVPAGAFTCFRIEGQGTGISDEGVQIMLERRIWVAPDRVRRAIVSESRRSVARRGGPRRVVEAERSTLLSFSQA